ncbi:MAG: HAD-IIB family hydrolase [Proteobacteria bacterium]|nr:HAD-IIB family hydrolase [Pseudomonadota bacterium]
MGLSTLDTNHTHTKNFAAKWLVFTDLDGTLLDRRYDLRAAGEAMDTLHGHGCICVPASSKTHLEMMELNRFRKFPSPYVFENGAGLCWPSALEPEHFGRNADEICDLLDHIGVVHDFSYRTFRHIDAKELQAITGLSESAAGFAKQRTGSMPLLWEDSPQALESFSEALGFIGLQVVQGGRFHTVLDKSCNKSLGMRKIAEHFMRPENAPILISCGDAKNDLEMLALADIAVLFPKTDGSYLKFNHPVVHYATASGHEHWLGAMQQILGIEESFSEHSRLRTETLTLE